MRSVAGIVIALALAACGEPARTTVPALTEAVAPVVPAVAAPAVPAVLNEADLRRVCRAGLAAIHGQTEAAILIDGLEGRIVNASWRAPVDGGRRRAQCRVDGDRVTWKPLERLTPGDNRWMDQAGDPVTRFVLDGGTVTIDQATTDDGPSGSADPVARE